MTDQVVTVGVHNPQVKRVQRFERDGDLHIVFGNPAAMHGEIGFYLSEDAWQAIIADVAAKIPDAYVIPMSNQ